MSKPILDLTPAQWVARAACNPHNADAWFPARAQGNRGNGGFKRDRAFAADAIATCEQCPVRLACLQHALDNDERHGVWGGLTEAELAELRTQAAS